MADSDDRCECSHSKHDHTLTVGSVSKWGFLTDGFFRTSLIGQGLCKKCMCPKFKQITFLNHKTKEYSTREIKLDISENRCGKCGRLLENHENIGHDFKN